MRRVGPSDAHRDFDRLSAVDLRRKGSYKWTADSSARIGAGHAEMDIGTAPVITEALERAVADGSLGYAAPPAVARLAAACARWHGERFGWVLDPALVKTTADVLRALELTLQHFDDRAGAVVVPTPAYPPFLAVAASAGRRVVEVAHVERAGRHELDLEGIDRAFAAGATLLLLCNPSNPTGRVYTRAELDPLIEIVDRHGARVFSDDVHAPLIYPGFRHLPYASLSPTAAGHTITATSASKGWNIAGLKCAQVVLNEPDLDRWNRLGPVTTRGASALGVVANTAAYEAGDAWVDETVEYLQGNRDLLSRLLAQGLPGLTWTPPEATYLAWLDCRGLGWPPEPARHVLARAGVACSEGAAFGAGGAGYLRLNFATSAAILTELVTMIQTALLQPSHDPESDNDRESRPPTERTRTRR